MNLSKPEILKEAIRWINNGNEFEKEMNVLEHSMVEHKHCYSFSWCVKGEENIIPKEPIVGIGRLLISKDGKFKEFEGSTPFVDWIHHFELKIQNLEDYWYLEIPYKKEYISKLKVAINCSTSELLKMVNPNGKIIFEESKAWNNHFPTFYQIADDLHESGVDCQVEIRIRKKSL